jgi:hypothetical protein
MERKETQFKIFSSECFFVPLSTGYCHIMSRDAGPYYSTLITLNFHEMAQAGNHS